MITWSETVLWKYAHIWILALINNFEYNYTSSLIEQYQNLGVDFVFMKRYVEPISSLVVSATTRYGERYLDGPISSTPVAGNRINIGSNKLTSLISPGVCVVFHGLRSAKGSNQYFLFLFLINIINFSEFLKKRLVPKCEDEIYGVWHYKYRVTEGIFDRKIHQTTWITVSQKSSSTIRLIKKKSSLLSSYDGQTIAWSNTHKMATTPQRKKNSSRGKAGEDFNLRVGFTSCHTQNKQSNMIMHQNQN